MVKELIQREEYPAPTFRMNKAIKNFYDFTLDDFQLIGYKAGKQMKIPVAI